MKSQCTRIRSASNLVRSGLVFGLLAASGAVLLPLPAAAAAPGRAPAVAAAVGADWYEDYAWYLELIKRILAVEPVGVDGPSLEETMAAIAEDFYANGLRPDMSPEERAMLRASILDTLDHINVAPADCEVEGLGAFADTLHEMLLELQGASVDG
ncbi:MAG: hypothetical protein WD749_10350 [Phycisphaerales bacterium]